MADGRPLSPHLQIYKPQLTSVLSITHRATGAFLCAGTLVLAYWLAALAAGPVEYAMAQGRLGSPLGQILLFLWTAALFYHLCNGIRHLFWDAGKGLELDEAYASGRWVLVGTAVLTLLAWIIGYAI
ncbi:MAG: succinate dehydrogenase, cytochrome b556 subunit [Gammaproteobacteria bacterium]|nr:succinate dehydrogenase, cytochrome b556 subunit [Gammaproteobacteria bacterium]